MPFCSKCGAENVADVNFCGKCGNSLSSGPVQTKPWFTTFMLCWILGGFGVHRFYVGKVGSGIAQLLTFGGLGIWWFIDWIMLIVNSFTDKAGNKIIRKSGDGKKLGILFGIFVVLIIVVIVIAVNIPSDSSTSNSLNIVKSSLNTVNTEPLSNLGDTLKASSIYLIVTNIKPLSSIGGNDFVEATRPSEGAIYLTVQYKYKNISNKALGMFSKPTISLVDPNGNSYDADIAASGAFAMEVDDNEKVISDLNPGISVKSSTVFEVANELLQQPGWCLHVEFDDQTFKVNVNKETKQAQAKSIKAPENSTTSLSAEVGPNIETGVFTGITQGEDVSWANIKSENGKEYSFMLVEDFEGSSYFTNGNNAGKKVKFVWKRAKVMTPGGEDEIDKLLGMVVLE
jgi:TM2 domain-containing membrane protein YozV